MSGASKDTAPSGFTRSIDSEMEQAAPLPVESAFSGLSQCYVSASGHTRLLTATRYGKRYMLKCLKADFLYTPVYRQALTKEFEIGLQLDHGIFIGFCFSSGSPFSHIVQICFHACLHRNGYNLIF